MIETEADGLVDETFETFEFISGIRFNVGDKRNDLLQGSLSVHTSEFL